MNSLYSFVSLARFRLIEFSFVASGFTSSRSCLLKAVFTMQQKGQLVAHVNSAHWKKPYLLTTIKWVRTQEIILFVLKIFLF